MNRNKDTDAPADAPADGPEDALSDAPLGGNADAGSIGADSDGPVVVPVDVSTQGGAAMPGMKDAEVDDSADGDPRRSEFFDESRNALGAKTDNYISIQESEAGADSFDGGDDDFGRHVGEDGGEDAESDT